MDGAGLEATGRAGAKSEGLRSTCPYCGVGCGVLLRPDGSGGLSVTGDPDHPTNRGRLCSKGSALAETLGRAHRLLAPRVNGAETGWDAALQTVADRFRATIAEHGPDSVAFYVSGQLLTEDYYVANKLMKGFIGSANIDTNSRLCMSSTVVGHKRAFGTDTVPGTYADIDAADLVVLVGSNLAWCHPILYQRLLAARADHGTKIVVIDPRRTASCDQADLHLPLAPGADVALFNHLLAEIARTGATDPAFLAHVTGAEAAMAAAQKDDVTATGLSPDQLAAFSKMWIRTEKVVTIFSQGVNQSSSGSDKVNAILNCHLATGRIGRPGMGPFSVTGQPNAMGGREVGGLANMLACHLDLENPSHRAIVQDHWHSPAMATRPGLKAVDLFQAVAQGDVKALWIIHTNPAVSMPEADAVRAAIAACPFTVVSDISDKTDTARLADVLLPAAAWGEKSGTVTNSDRTISRQRAALSAPGSARPDWWILAEVARRMGWAEAFSYAGPADIFREYAALSGKAATQGRDFDISALAEISNAEYDALAPTRWPVSARRTERRTGGRFFADGAFFHPDGKARMLPLRHRAPAARPEGAFRFRLNTGRLRDQWHTMTRTGLSPRLSAHLPEPFLELHPKDAAALGIGPADLVEVTGQTGGRAILRARIRDAVAPGNPFAPIHWTGETAPTGRIDAVVPAVTDPLSGQPESKAAMVALARFPATRFGFAVSTGRMTPGAQGGAAQYWAQVPTQAGFRAELAWAQAPTDWAATARALFGLDRAATDPEDGYEMSIVEDRRRGQVRIAFHRAGRLCAALFVAPEPVAVMRDHLATCPGTAAPHVLTGMAPADLPDPGPTVCACFAVGRNTILRAIEEGGLMSVDAIGDALGAGTNCGSCKPELEALLHDEFA